MRYKRTNDDRRPIWSGLELYGFASSLIIACLMITWTLIVVAIWSNDHVQHVPEHELIQEEITKLNEITRTGELVLYYEQEAMRTQLAIQTIATNIYISYRETIRESGIDEDQLSMEIERCSVLCTNASIDDINTMVGIINGNHEDLNLYDVELMARQLPGLESKFHEYRQNFNSYYAKYQELLSKYSEIVKKYDYIPITSN